MHIDLVHALADADRILRKHDAWTVDRAASRAQRNPTKPQIDAGNYRMGHLRLHGLDISIENQAGQQRKGNGWRVTMPAHYGYIRRTEGADGDHVDVYIGPNPKSGNVYLIDQVDANTGLFDEHKAMLGYFHRADALNAYDLGFSDGKGPARRGAVTEMTIDQFKNWLRAGDTKKPYDHHIIEKASELAGAILRKIDDEDDPVRLAESVETTLSDRIEGAFNWLRSIANDVVGAATQTGTEGALAAVPRADIGQRLDVAFRPLDSAFTGGARIAANSNVLPPREDDKQIRFTFEARNARVADELQNYKLDLIRGITDKQHETIRQVIGDALNQGLPPAQMARNLRDTINLTPNQAQQVLNYRNELANLLQPGNAQGALQRQLRDQRFDRTIQSALTNNRALSDGQIDTMVSAYQRRYVNYRANTIARTESLRAVNLGTMAVAQSTADSLGNVDVIKKWIATNDQKTRDTHRALDGTEVTGIDTPWITTHGNEIRFPHDPDADPSETINCRCSFSVRYAPKDSSDSDNADNSDSATEEDIANE